VDPEDCAHEHPSSFSPDAQPFTPKTSSGMLSVVADEPTLSGITASSVLSPNAPEFVPQHFKPTSKVLLLYYIFFVSFHHLIRARRLRGNHIPSG